MTGGIGFSRHGSPSFKENLKLGKIRPKSEAVGISRDGKNTDLKILSEAIEYRNMQKSRLKNQSLIILGLVGLRVIILAYLFFD
jgi:hypothetical protein